MEQCIDLALNVDSLQKTEICPLCELAFEPPASHTKQASKIRLYFTTVAGISHTFMRNYLPQAFVERSLKTEN